MERPAGLRTVLARLDLAGRRALVKAKGARLLPRLLKGRTRGPVFTTHRRPGPDKAVSARDVCPDTCPARLSYGRARLLAPGGSMR